MNGDVDHCMYIVHESRESRNPPLEYPRIHVSPEPHCSESPREIEVFVANEVCSARSYLFHRDPSATSKGIERGEEEIRKDSSFDGRDRENYKKKKGKKTIQIGMPNAMIICSECRSFNIIRNIDA